MNVLATASAERPLCRNLHSRAGNVAYTKEGRAYCLKCKRESNRRYMRMLRASRRPGSTFAPPALVPAPEPDRPVEEGLLEAIGERRRLFAARVRLLRDAIIDYPAPNYSQEFRAKVRALDDLVAVVKEYEALLGLMSEVCLDEAPAESYESIEESIA